MLQSVAEFCRVLQSVAVGKHLEGVAREEVTLILFNAGVVPLALILVVN